MGKIFDHLMKDMPEAKVGPSTLTVLGWVVLFLVVLPIAYQLIVNPGG